MDKWSKISLYKYQQLEAMKDRTDLPDIDKTLFSICALFGMTEYELDNAGIKKANELAEKFTQILKSQFEPKVKRRIGWYTLKYDISAMTFGQYVELSSYLAKPTANAHKVLASISYDWKGRNLSDDHEKKADYFLSIPVTIAIGSVKVMIENMQSFRLQYKSLFGLDKEVHGDAQEDQFNKVYGWIHSAERIAAYERITNDQAFQLPVRQAFHDLNYIKAKDKYETEQLKKK